MDTDTLPIEQLLNIMRRLRDPQDGCAWDIKQNFKTIAPYTLEEAYEVLDAIERNDLDDLRDELGDLLLQVVFHAQMASELGAFTFDDVASSINEKMIRRHPHVFGDKKFSSEQELKASWDAIKAEERQAKLNKAAKPTTNTTSAVDGIARTLPALSHADKLQTRAARVGFDWPDIRPVWSKLDEEIGEVKEAIGSGSQDATEDEIGDLLFTVVNLARHASVDAEQALKRSSAKFESRFREVEQLAETREASMQQMTLEQLDALWDEAKRKRKRKGKGDG